jgi:hydroxyethylthiazole kinase-like uncharacterized protein yjeF
MDPLYTVQQLRFIEQHALQQGMPLMQRAGESAAQFLATHPFVHFLIIAGPGNNGGDALVLATLLIKQGKVVYVWQPFGRATSLEAKKAEKAFLAIGAQLHAKAPLSYQFDCLVDGLFGIGLNRMLSPESICLIDMLNSHHFPTLALDIPTGVNADEGSLFGTAIKATWTISYIAAKPGCYTGAAVDYCGAVIVDTLGMPTQYYPAPSHYLINTTPWRHLLQRPSDTHKGLYGTVGIIGGDSGMQGAALLAARGALYTGAGKVHIGFIASDYPTVDLTLPDLMLHAAATLLNPPFLLSVLAMGPGLGTSTHATNMLAHVLNLDVTLILDADALNLISALPDLRVQLQTRQAQTLLTPHPTEAARLLGVSTKNIQACRITYAKQLAQIMQSHVILKGAGSIYSDGNNVYINHSGNAALSMAGQGDVLTGVIAGLMAQHLPPSQAALLAMYLHGKAAEKWCVQYPRGLGLTASETILLIRTLLNQTE